MARKMLAFLILGIFASPSIAATPRHRPVAKHNSHVQAHYSLIDGKPIHAQITQHSTVQATPSCSPDTELKPTTSIKKELIPVQITSLHNEPVYQSQSPRKPPSRLKRALTFNKTGLREHSWVAGINAEQAKILASEITTFLSAQTDPNNTTIVLAKPTRKQWNNPLTFRLETKLRQAGFAISQSLSQTPSAQGLRYQVERINETGVLLRLSFQGKEATRYFFRTNDTDLVASYPFSIRLKGEKQ